MFRYVACVLALTAIAPHAWSGPIQWTAMGHSMTAPGGSFVWVGNDTKTTYDPTTGIEAQTEKILLANIAANYSWAGTDSQRFGALSVGPMEIGSYSVSDGWANNQPNEFILGLTVTDTASGEAGQMSFRSRGFADGYFTSGSFVMNLSVEDAVWSGQLGDNVYTVRPVVRRSESADTIEFDVSTTANTPEPATLAMAGFGLAAAGLMRLRRRGSR